ncbi:MAG: TonB-dependent receptor plug domain-containing protein [Salinibacter sp.]
MMRSVPLFLVVLSFLSVGPVQAQDTSDVAFRVRMPDSVVVTASRTPTTTAETGRRVSVYTQQEIQALSVNSVDQLLDVVAGIDVQSRGGFGVQSDLRMRGSTFNGVLLLLDGARINDPYTGHFLMDLPVPLSEIARVEVLHGPATALYGPDALGGVVHLITKTALRSGRMNNTGVSATAEGRYGKNNLYDVGGSVRYVGSNTAVSAAASVQGSDGQLLRPPGPDSLANTVRTDFQRQVATAAVTRRVGEALLYARAGIDNREFGAYHYYTNFSTDRAREATSTFWFQSRLKSAGDTDTPWQVQIAGKQHRDRYTYNSTLSANRHVSRMLNVQGQVSQERGAVRVTGGVSGGLRGVNSTRDGVHSDASAGAFVNLRWRATPRLTVNQSTRVDYDPVYGVQPTPQLYLAYELGVVTLRAGGGRVVRAPNYVERFIDSPTNQGNENLDAETAWSGEVGGNVRLPAGLSLSVTGFRRTTQNSIDYLKKPGAFVFRARNLDRTTTTGLETELSMDRRVGSASVHFNAGYTLLDAAIDAKWPAKQYKYALTNARHLVQGNASVNVRGLTFSVQGLWKDRLKDAGLATNRYGVVDGRLGYRTQLGGTPLTFSVEVRNLFDREYTEIFDAPMPDRTLLVGASIRL